MPKVTKTKLTTTLRDTVKACRCCLRFPSYDVIFHYYCTYCVDSLFNRNKVLRQMIGRFGKVFNFTLEVHCSVKLLEGNLLVG